VLRSWYGVFGSGAEDLFEEPRSARAVANSEPARVETEEIRT